MDDQQSLLPATDPNAARHEQTHDERTVQAKLVRVLYPKDWKVNDSGFIIAKWLNIDNKREFVGKGTVVPIVPNCLYELKGKPEYSHRYKEFQLAIREGRISSSNDEEGLISYLSSEALGLGETRARDLVRAFGKQVFAVLAKQPDDVAKIRGLTPARAKELQDWIVNEKKLSQAKYKLYALGLSSHIIRLLLNEFGQKAYEELQARCFELTYIKGIGFKTVSKMSLTLGIPSNNPARIKAGIQFTIEELMADGHTCVPWQMAVSESTNLLEVHKNSIIDQIKLMLDSKQLIKDSESPLAFVSDLEVFKETGHDLNPEQYSKWQELDEQRRSEFLARLEGE